MAEDSTKTQLKSYETGLANTKSALSEKNKQAVTTEEAREANVLGNVSENAEKMMNTAIAGQAKKGIGVINADGSISEMSYVQGSTAKITKDVSENVKSTENFQQDMLTASDKQTQEAEVRFKSESKSIPTKPTYSGSDASAATIMNYNANKPQIEADIKHNEALQTALSNAKEMQEAIKKGDWAKVGELNASNKIDLANDGMVSSFTAQRGTLQGGSQSGVSYSHNESSNYSYGTSASGGSLFAGMAQSMGMNMGTFASMSSSIAAAGMLMPGGRLGGVLSNMGVIDGESTYAMGVGSAVKLKRNNATTQANEAKSAVSSMGKAQGKLTNAKREFESAMDNSRAMGGSKFMDQDESDLSRLIAGSKSAIQGRQGRHKYLLSTGMKPTDRQVMAVEGSNKKPSSRPY